MEATPSGRSLPFKYRRRFNHNHHHHNHWPSALNDPPPSASSVFDYSEASASSSPIASSAALDTSEPNSPTDYAHIHNGSPPRSDYYYAFRGSHPQQYPVLDHDHHPDLLNYPSNHKHPQCQPPFLSPVLSASHLSPYPYPYPYHPVLPSSASASSSTPRASSYDAHRSALDENAASSDELDFDPDFSENELDSSCVYSPSHRRRISFSTSAERDRPILRPPPPPPRPTVARLFPAPAPLKLSPRPLKRPAVPPAKTSTPAPPPRAESHSFSPLPPSSPPLPSSPVSSRSSATAVDAHDSSPLPQSSPILPAVSTPPPPSLISHHRDSISSPLTVCPSPPPFPTMKSEPTPEPAPVPLRSQAPRSTSLLAILNPAPDFVPSPSVSSSSASSLGLFLSPSPVKPASRPPLLEEDLATPTISVVAPVYCRPSTPPSPHVAPHHHQEAPVPTTPKRTPVVCSDPLPTPTPTKFSSPLSPVITPERIHEDEDEINFGEKDTLPTLAVVNDDEEERGNEESEKGEEGIGEEEEEDSQLMDLPTSSPLSEPKTSPAHLLPLPLPDPHADGEPREEQSKADVKLTLSVPSIVVVVGEASPLSSPLSPVSFFGTHDEHEHEHEHTEAEEERRHDESKLAGKKRKLGEATTVVKKVRIVSDVEEDAPQPRSRRENQETQKKPKEKVRSKKKKIVSPEFVLDDDEDSDYVDERAEHEGVREAVARKQKQEKKMKLKKSMATSGGKKVKSKMSEWSDDNDEPATAKKQKKQSKKSVDAVKATKRSPRVVYSDAESEDEEDSLPAVAASPTKHSQGAKPKGDDKPKPSRSSAHAPAPSKKRKSLARADESDEESETEAAPPKPKKRKANDVTARSSSPGLGASDDEETWPVKRQPNAAKLQKLPKKTSVRDDDDEQEAAHGRKRKRTALAEPSSHLNSQRSNANPLTPSATTAKPSNRSSRRAPASPPSKRLTPAEVAEKLSSLSSRCPRDLGVKELEGMLIETLATSRASSQAVDSVWKGVCRVRPSVEEMTVLMSVEVGGSVSEEAAAPSGQTQEATGERVEKPEEGEAKEKVMEEREVKITRKEWLSLVLDVLEYGRLSSGVFGRVESSFKDEHAHPLPPHYFYVPENDPDSERASLIKSTMPRPAKRTETKKYKQYYWKPLGKVSRWESEDTM